MTVYLSSKPGNREKATLFMCNSNKFYQTLKAINAQVVSQLFISYKICECKKIRTTCRGAVCWQMAPDNKMIQPDFLFGFWLSDGTNFIGN